MVRSARLSVGLLAGALVLCGCPGSTPGPAADSGADAALVIDCGGREAEWGPVFARFRAETGGSIEPHFGASPELAERWLRAGEGNASDLILAEEAGWLGALSDQNLLEALPASILEAVEPQFHGALGRWVGISARLFSEFCIAVRAVSTLRSARSTSLRDAVPFCDSLARRSCSR